MLGGTTIPGRPTTRPTSTPFACLTPYEPPDLCEPRDACPDCGNRNKDELVWDDDDRLTCTLCGREYDPMEKEDGDECVEEGRDDAGGSR